MQNTSLPMLYLKFSMNVKMLKQALSRNQNENIVNLLRLAMIPAIIDMRLSFSPNLDLRRAVN